MIKKVESPGKKRGRPPRLGERDFSTGIVSTWKLYTKGGNIGRPTFRPVFSRINREFFLLLLLLFFFLSLRMKPRYLVSHGLLYGQKGL